MADRETASGVLGLVQAYVNTADLETGTDLLNDPNTLAAWLVATGLMSSGEASAADLRHAVAVREAIRGVIGANAGAAVYPVDVATLNGAAVASRLRARFGSDGKARLEPEASGVEGALGRMVAAVFAAMGDDDWEAPQAVRLADLPLGVLRQVQEPLEPLVPDGLLRQSPEGEALQGAREDILTRTPTHPCLDALCVRRSVLHCPADQQRKAGDGRIRRRRIAWRRA